MASTWPYLAAMNRGVLRAISKAFILTACLTSSFIIATKFLLAAQWRAV